MLEIRKSCGFPSQGLKSIFWLGQAGFWIDTGSSSILIDPYLSDYLAKKYHGTKHPHIRMMNPPVSMNDIPEPDVALITHAHSDHMDPFTLKRLAARFPKLRFIVPKSKIAIARERIGLEADLIGVDADEVFNVFSNLRIHVFPAAHETLKLSDDGFHEFLGYGIETDQLRIYHSGDCVPFSGLNERLHLFRPQIALLPVNGRDKERLNDGIPGNFTLNEAINLAISLKIPYLIPHHFGMFETNTIDPSVLEIAAELTSDQLRLLIPRAGECFYLRSLGLADNLNE